MFLRGSSAKERRQMLLWGQPIGVSSRSDESFETERSFGDDETNCCALHLGEDKFSAYAEFPRTPSTAAHLAPREEDGFVPRRTGGDQGYGSLQSFVGAWNAADLAEVNSNPKQNPAGPSALGQKMYDVMVAS